LTEEAPDKVDDFPGGHNVQNSDPDVLL